MGPDRLELSTSPLSGECSNQLSYEPARHRGPSAGSEKDTRIAVIPLRGRFLSVLLFYNLLLTLGAPIWVPWTILRARRRGTPVNWKERQGKYPQLGAPGDRARIWLHAVSVGEVVAAVPILRRLRADPSKPEIVLTVTTSSGHETAGKAHGAMEGGLYDHLLYFPIDVARFAMSAMQAVRPNAFAIMETELWFNALYAARTFDASTLLVNGRVSERNHRRSKVVRPFYLAMLEELDRALMQTEGDASRIKDLGASGVAVLGNVKFDEAREAPTRGREFWLAELGFDPSKPVIVIGSTRGVDEEEFILAALDEVGREGLQIVHAPRHIERAEAIVAKVPGSARRSLGQKGSYTILDTYGELADVYAAADVAIIGGAFGENGGQNILQPLARGVPTLHGPHMTNFRDVARIADEAGATRTCATPEQLAQALRDLLANEPVRREMGSRATALFETHAGAADRYTQAILEAAAEGKAAYERRTAELRTRRANATSP